MLFEQDWIKNEWLSHHLLRSGSGRNTFLLSRIRLYIMYAHTRAKASGEHPPFSLHTAKCQTWGCVFNLHDNISLSSTGRLNSLCIDGFQRMPWYIYFGMLFHVMWNVVPYHLERGSTSHGTGLYLSDSVAVNQKAQYKGLAMAFRKQMSKGLNNGFVCCVCRIIGARTPLYCGQSCDTRPAPLHKRP